MCIVFHDSCCNKCFQADAPLLAIWYGQQWYGGFKVTKHQKLPQQVGQNHTLPPLQHPNSPAAATPAQ